MKNSKTTSQSFKVPRALINALAPFRDEARRDVLLKMLGMYARVDEDLAKLLHALAAGCTLELWGAAHNNPEFFRPIARPEGAWPVLGGFYRDEGKTLALLERIELGRDFWLNVNKGKRQWSERTPEVRVALRLLAEMSRCRRGGFHRYDAQDEKAWEMLVRELPPFSRAASAKWFSAAMPLFHYLYDYGERNYGGHFEEAEEFRHYWKGNAYREPDRRNPRKKSLMRNARALIRRDIKKSLKQAFRSLAPRSAAVG